MAHNNLSIYVNIGVGPPARRCVNTEMLFFHRVVNLTHPFYVHVDSPGLQEEDGLSSATRSIKSVKKAVSS